MSVEQIRYTEIIKDKVQELAYAVARQFLLEDAIRQKPMYLLRTGFKYHQFFDTR